MKRKAAATPAWLIARYLESRNIKQAAFGRLAGVHQAMVSQWLAGTRPVSAKAALAIEKNTDGVLSRFDLCPQIFQHDSAA
jgi:DNA-binding transcriptional regulator YdaS (Cro superfamily)